MRAPRTGWFTPRWIVRAGVIVVLAAVVMTTVIHAADVHAGTATFIFTVAAFLLSITLMRRRLPHITPPSNNPTPAEILRPHPELLCAHNSLTHSLCQLAGQTDEILLDCATVRLAVIQEELRTLAESKVVFAGTEAWRTAYERILRTQGLGRYFSVAWLRSEDYWRDAPGRHSMQLNYDLIQLGVRIERTLILNDFFWPPAAVLPAKAICQWIEEQYKRGIVIRLIRESQIADEPQLLMDFGLYGRRAVGQLELDESCRTVRFTLDFTPQAVSLFEERWRRLLLFAVSFREVLDRTARGG
jgi:hypothetical protein